MVLFPNHSILKQDMTPTKMSKNATEYIRSQGPKLPAWNRKSNINLKYTKTMAIQENSLFPSILERNRGIDK